MSYVSAEGLGHHHHQQQQQQQLCRSGFVTCYTSKILLKL
jgi:hypothetical protein